MFPFTIFEDKSMCINYNFPDFPVFVKTNNNLETYSKDYASYLHWHPDIELSYTVSGVQDIFINGEYVHVAEGECIFINSHRMHYGSSLKQNECIFHVANIHPSLLTNSSDAIKIYINQRFSISNIDYIIFSVSIPWQKKVIDGFLELIAEANKHEPSVLQLLARINAICADICDNIIPVKSSINEAPMQIEFLKMVEYIHHQKLTMDMIASSGAASLSKCHRLFKHFAKQSPNVFLTRFRLAKSIELLLDTELSITQIALSCGFQTASFTVGIVNQLTKRLRIRNNAFSGINHRRIVIYPAIFNFYWSLFLHCCISQQPSIQLLLLAEHCIRKVFANLLINFDCLYAATMLLASLIRSALFTIPLPSMSAS